MRYLLDTHVLLWAASDDKRISARLRDILVDERNQLVFSVVSIWEVVIKAALGRDDFTVDARLLRQGALDAGYQELDVRGPHVLEVDRLKPIHNDPFDRLLLAQAQVDDVLLLTVDHKLLRYGNPAVAAS